jgi:2-methylisocitrate lyase-like PEP mutase family enzyme
MQRTQAEKAAAFRALPASQGFGITKAPARWWSARILEGLGFEALATTSAGHAWSRAALDNRLPRDVEMQHLVDLTSATSVPVNADLGHCFGDDPATAAETIRRAAAAGVVGGSVEDSTKRQDEPIYPQTLASERVRATAEAARSLPFPFTLTARCENYLVGRTDLRDTIQRLQSYQEAGADVLYAPGIVAKADIAAVVSSVDRPVNVLAGMPSFPWTVADLSALGVKRISLGGALARMALGGLLRAAREMREHGSFGFTKEAISSSEFVRFFA